MLWILVFWLKEAPCALYPPVNYITCKNYELPLFLIYSFINDQLFHMDIEKIGVIT